MTMHRGRTLLIANPAAQNGKGELAAVSAEGVLRQALGDDNFVVERTVSAYHATNLAENAHDFDTVLALGGDGIVHEVANGLMRLPASSRPVLGVLPVGSGNDYGRTLGMSFTLSKAVQQVLSAPLHTVDVGCCNGVYFVETLSFGLDAAIALDTVERRKRTGHTGTLLYAASGIDQLLHHLREYEFKASLPEKPCLTGAMFLMAVQIGPTYGGGFLICPQAQPDDGLFDICIARPPLSIPRGTVIFLLAKNGLHAHFKQVEFHQANAFQVSFDEQVPAQVDGEPLVAREFDVKMMPQALSVIMPACART